MADNNAEELSRREERLFGLKKNLDGLNQEIAYNFYPERADFTVQRWLGTEFAIDLFDSAPVLDRRDLGNARAAMLRPRGQQWFKAQLADERLNERPEVAQLFDRMNARARSLMYQAKTGFVRAQKEADHDLVTFGNAVQTIEPTRGADGRQHVLCRDWHLRDVVWLDDADGNAQDFVARRFKASARHIKKKFPGATLHGDIEQSLKREPDQEYNLCHVMMLAEEYEYRKKPRLRTPFASIYYDREHKTILRERPTNRFRYVIQRWATVSGFQYALSPAAIASLSDARGLQTMARVILEAGEKALDPPLKATQKAIKGTIDIAAGSVTWIDREYDERLGPALAPIFPQDIKPAIGIELINRTTEALKNAWYLSKLSLPPPSADPMTATETAQRVEEFIRANIPLFEPWEADTELVLSEIFGVLLDIGAFGDMAGWPAPLAGADLEFVFSNPLQEAIERNKVNQAQQVIGFLAGAAQIDPNARAVVDVPEMVADAVRGTGAPSDWIHDPEQVEAAKAQSATAQGILGALNTAGQAADVVNSGADAAAKIRDLATQPNAAGEGVYGPT